ncbi:MAG: 50S ribosomal protein L30e-like protein [Linnemannia elongata]|nr:MAG: 50S ribosomal protein L30e-like protein [Linnemannia elongata]
MGLDRTVRISLNFNINCVLRQRQLLDNRRRVNPKLRYFTKLLDKRLTHLLFKFANKYRPETRIDNKRRRRVVDPVEVAVAAFDEAANRAPYFLKYGMNHVAELTEKQRAQLVAISDDIEPPEVLIWLPAMCRLNNVPYAIIKSSARLGTLVNKRSATAVAFTEIREEEKLEFSQLADAINVCYAKINRQPVRSSWMGGLLGFKSKVKVALRATATANRLRQQQQQ